MQLLYLLEYPYISALFFKIRCFFMKVEVLKMTNGKCGKM